MKLFAANLLLGKKLPNPIEEGGGKPVARLVKKKPPNPVRELSKNQTMRIIV